MDYSNQRDKTLILREKGKMHQFYIEDIVYFECEGYVSTIHTNNEEKPVSCSILLKEIEEKVYEYGFCRISRNRIVNLKFFKSYVSGKRRYFVTSNGIEMKVSRRKWCIFKRTLEK
jgi:DNA-binding LytR/AlgR family response regulator